MTDLGDSIKRANDEIERLNREASERFLELIAASRNVSGPLVPFVGSTDQWEPLVPKNIVDVTTRGRWRRDYRSGRRWFKSRYFWCRLRVPWIIWALFS